MVALDVFGMQNISDIEISGRMMCPKILTSEIIVFFSAFWLSVSFRVHLVLLVNYGPS